jgi:DNA-binding CsgD family transcriptional regulator
VGTPDLFRQKGNWADVIDAMNGPATTDEAWADAIIDAGETVFAPGTRVGVYTLRVTDDDDAPEFPLWRPTSWGSFTDNLMSITRAYGRPAWGPFHFSAPVLTYLEGKRFLQDGPVREDMRALEEKHSYGDGLAIIAHPMPGTVAVMHAWSEHRIDLLAHDRRVLTRIALHLDAAYRLRTVPQTAVAEISSRGVIDRLERAPDAERLEAHVKNMRHARKTRDPEMWAALVEGRVSVVARGGGFLVLENPPSQHSLRALTPGEASVISLAARGLPTKLVAYGLGISPSVVSQRLAQAAAKVGLFSRPELLRVATLLTREPRSSLDEEVLSDAEREIYELLRRGLSNRAIASLRSRSMRTIANQVASILRKTRHRSRRELLTNAADD